MHALGHLRELMVLHNHPAGPVGNLQMVIFGWEHAANAAFREVFPELTRKGCAFHYDQSIIRRIKSPAHSLIREYRNAENVADNRNVRNLILLALGLPLLPTNQKRLVWNQYQFQIHHADAQILQKMHVVTI